MRTPKFNVIAKFNSLTGSWVASWLLYEFTARKHRNRRFTQKAFAKKLGLSQSTLDAIYSGQKSMSSSTLKSISRKLKLRPERDFLVTLMHEADCNKNAQVKIFLENKMEALTA